MKKINYIILKQKLSKEDKTKIQKVKDKSKTIKKEKFQNNNFKHITMIF